MWHIFHLISDAAVSTAKAAAEYPRDTVPTAEEPGFKMTVNLGQIIQFIGIGVPFLLYINKVSVRHALMDANMKTLNNAVSALQNDMKTMSAVLSQIPGLVRTTHSNHRILQSVINNRVRDIMTKDPDEDENNDEFLNQIAERVSKLGEK